MRWIILTGALGLTGCAVPVTDAGICIGLKPPVDALASALLNGAGRVPDEVGEAGVDVVLGFRAGCAP